MWFILTSTTRIKPFFLRLKFYIFQILRIRHIIGLALTIGGVNWIRTSLVEPYSPRRVGSSYFVLRGGGRSRGQFIPGSRLKRTIQPAAALFELTLITPPQNIKVQKKIYTKLSGYFTHFSLIMPPFLRKFSMTGGVTLKQWTDAGCSVTTGLVVSSIRLGECCMFHDVRQRSSGGAGRRRG